MTLVNLRSGAGPDALPTRKYQNGLQTHDEPVYTREPTRTKGAPR